MKWSGGPRKIRSGSAKPSRRRYRAVCYRTTMLRRYHLRWDPVNVAHIWRHGVGTNEVAEVVDGAPIVEPGHTGRTVLIVGPMLTGRMLAVVLEPEGAEIYYPVTARPASRKERRRYAAARRGAGP